MKWQCVEFARRYWLTKYNVIIPAVSWAAHIWNLKYVSRKGDYYQVPIVLYHNKQSKEKPREGDLLIYGSTPNQRVGHVAVVLEVCTLEDGKEVIHVGEQNQENDVLWKHGQYADELELCRAEGVDSFVYYSITHPDTDLELLGWVRLSLDEITPRPSWVRQPDIVQENGVYDIDTAKAFQRFLGAHPDGSHGGFTNMSIRNYFRELVPSDEAVVSRHGKDILDFLRRYFIEHPLLSKSSELLSMSPSCNRMDCVCSCIYNMKDREVQTEEKEEKEEEVLDSAGCLTTLVLQEFLNTIRHPYDIPSALNELSHGSL